jgi:hypothetical protein
MKHGKLKDSIIIEEHCYGLSPHEAIQMLESFDCKTGEVFKECARTTDSYKLYGTYLKLAAARLGAGFIFRTRQKNLITLAYFDLRAVPDARPACIFIWDTVAKKCTDERGTRNEKRFFDGLSSPFTRDDLLNDTDHEGNVVIILGIRGTILSDLIFVANDVLIDAEQTVSTALDNAAMASYIDFSLRTYLKYLYLKPSQHLEIELNKERVRPVDWKGPRERFSQPQIWSCSGSLLTKDDGIDVLAIHPEPARALPGFEMPQGFLLYNRDRLIRRMENKFLGDSTVFLTAECLHGTPFKNIGYVNITKGSLASFLKIVLYSLTTSDTCRVLTMSTLSIG